MRCGQLYVGCLNRRTLIAWPANHNDARCRYYRYDNHYPNNCHFNLKWKPIQVEMKCE